MLQENISFKSLDAEIKGTLFLPENSPPVPVMLLIHGAGGWKEDLFELATYLEGQGFGVLCLDMHGHGQSGGGRYYIYMKEWVPDIQAALDFLATRPEIDSGRVGAWGISSGGTAILEAALVESRLKALVTLDATVRAIMPLPMKIMLKTLGGVGWVKRKITKRDLRLNLSSMAKDIHLTSDPEINRNICQTPGSWGP